MTPDLPVVPTHNNEEGKQMCDCDSCVEAQGDRLTQRVERGMKRLDDYFGHREWDKGLNLGSLSLESTEQCVLGQLFGHFCEGTDTLGVSAVANGFATAYVSEYPTLTEIWREKIQQRRLDRAVPVEQPAEPALV